MIGRLMGDRVDVIRIGPTGDRDELNNPIIGEVHRATVPARLEQRESTERDTYTSSDWVAYMPIMVDVRPGDVVAHGAVTYDVVGAPMSNRVPGFPATDHQVVSLTVRAAVHP